MIKAFMILCIAIVSPAVFANKPPVSNWTECRGQNSTFDFTITRSSQWAPISVYLADQDGEYPPVTGNISDYRIENNCIVSGDVFRLCAALNRNNLARVQVEINSKVNWQASAVTCN